MKTFVFAIWKWYSTSSVKSTRGRYIKKEFANVYDWFVDNLPEFNMTYDNDGIKQYRKVEQLGCCHGVNLNEESMAIKNSLKKINTQSYSSYKDNVSF